MHLYVEDGARYFQSLFRCPNYKHGCLVEFRSEIELGKHASRCKTVKEVQENPTIIQSVYDHSEHPLAYAKEKGNINSIKYISSMVFIEIIHSVKIIISIKIMKTIFFTVCIKNINSI